MNEGRRCLPFHTWIRRNNQLPNPMLKPSHQGRDAEFIRTDPVQGRQAATQYVVATTKPSRPFYRRDIRRFLDYAQLERIPTRTATELARLVATQVPANRARLYFLYYPVDRSGFRCVAR